MFCHRFIQYTNLALCMMPSILRTLSSDSIACSPLVQGRKKRTKRKKERKREFHTQSLASNSFPFLIANLHVEMCEDYTPAIPKRHDLMPNLSQIQIRPNSNRTTR